MKQRAFVQAYDGNATAAAIAAGYSERTAYSIGGRLLKNVEIASAIHEREEAQRDKLIADRVERMMALTMIIRNLGETTRERIRAMDVLNKMTGEYLERVEIGQSEPVMFCWKEEEGDSMTAGGPRKIQTGEEFEERAEAYFTDCQKKGEPLTITGLCLGLGFSSRDTLREYMKRPEFSDTVKRAKLRVEHDYELALREGKNAAGAIFALKNFNWSDKPINTEPGPLDDFMEKTLAGVA